MAAFNTKWIRLFEALILLSCLITKVEAADIYPDDQQVQVVIHLDGEIRRGDADRLAIVMSEMKLPSLLIVDSKGGDIDESMKIVSLIKSASLSIYVAKGKVCASSCFFLYLAGSSRNSAGFMVNDDGTLQAQEIRDGFDGVVGIHRPYFKDPSGKPESTNKQKILMRNVKEYLEKEGVAQYLIDEMMSHPSNDIYWLNKRDVISIGEYSPDIEELLISKCGYKNIAKVVEERWSVDKHHSMRQCVEDVTSELNIPIRIAYATKLRTGWRPWKM